VIDEPGMHDARTEREVIEERHADAVEVVAGVSGRGAAHEEEREPARDGHDARQRLDGAKGIAEGSGHLANLASAHRRLTGFGACAAHLHLGLRGRLWRSAMNAAT